MPPRRLTPHNQHAAPAEDAPAQEQRAPPAPRMVIDPFNPADDGLIDELDLYLRLLPREIRFGVRQPAGRAHWLEVREAMINLLSELIELPRDDFSTDDVPVDYDYQEDAPANYDYQGARPLHIDEDLEREVNEFLERM